MKLDPDFQGSLAIFRLFKYSTDFQKKRNADLHFAIALQGNWRVLSMVGGRAGLPEFELVGKFHLNFPVYSNIEGGYGIVAAVSSDVRTFDYMFFHVNRHK